MKVTVSFDSVRLVVPCGDGQLPVSQLIDRAVARYCKTVGKVFSHHCPVIICQDNDNVHAAALTEYYSARRMRAMRGDVKLHE